MNMLPFLPLLSPTSQSYILRTLQKNPNELPLIKVENVLAQWAADVSLARLSICKCVVCLDMRNIQNAYQKLRTCG